MILAKVWFHYKIEEQQRHGIVISGTPRISLISGGILLDDPSYLKVPRLQNICCIFVR